MAEKATSANASEGEGEKASAQMQDLTLALPPSSKEKNASSPEVDLSVVLALLQQTQYSTYLEQTSKMEDIVFIQDTAAAAKALLSPEGAAGKQLGKLMETKEFLPFLLKCLRGTGDLPSSVQENAAWLVGTIIKHGEKHHIFKLRLTEAVTLLVKVVNSSDPCVREQVTSTIALIAANHIIREDLLTAQSSIDLCNALTKLLKMKRSEPSNEVLNNVSKIIYNLLVGNVLYSLVEGLSPEMASRAPSQDLVMPFLPVISILLDFPNTEVRCKQLQCLCTSAVGLSSITPFIVNDLCTKLVSYLELATEGHHTITGTAVALGTICTMGPADFLMFLKSVSGTHGLRNFWKCLQLAGELENENVKTAIYDVMNIIPYVVCVNSDTRATTDLIFDSGIVHAFVTSLQKDVPERLQVKALNNVGLLSNELSASRKGELINLSILTSAAKFLKSFNPKAISAASFAVGVFVQNYPEGRDEAISVGILSILLDILRKRTGTFPADVTHNYVRALHSILEVKPNIAIDAFKDVLETLKIFIKKNGVANANAAEANVVAIECVMEFTNFGNEGIDQIFATPSLAQKIISFLICRTAELQQKAVEVAKRICQQGTAQHRRKLLELNILEHLKDPLQGRLPENRKFALECLLELLDEELTSKQKRVLKKLLPIVKSEINLRMSETLGEARAVYSKLIALI